MKRLPAWILCVLGPFLVAPQLLAQTGSISASPNPCKIAAGKKTCTTTLSWSATGTSGLLVRVSHNGRASTVVSSSGRSGSTSPSWIQAAPSHTYTFYLYDYAGRVQGKLLDSVSVTGTAPPKPKPAPKISSFSASPSTIDKGKSSTLKWSTSNATSVSIDQGIGTVSASGSRKVSPSSTTTYTLKVTNSVKSVTSTAKVTVQKPKPVVSGSISASPNPCQIAAGKTTCTTTLSWSATGTTGLRVRVSRNGLPSRVVSSSGRSGSASPSWIRAAPADTYTFYLYNYAGRVQGKLLDSVKVTGKAPPKPKPAPKISSFSASPSTIDKGKSSILKWSTSNADTLSISPGVGTLTDVQRRLYARTGLKVSPSKTTTYTLTATNSTKSVTATAKVTVRPPPKTPTIISFTATPATIDRGENSTLRWRTSNADSVSISASINPGVGKVSSDGSRVVSPTATTTYTLTATNSVGSVTAKVTVRVRGAPQISGFTASPATIDKGKSSTLSWRTTDATSVSIDQGIGTVSTSGSRKVSPTATTTYTLKAANASGSATATATVTIRGSPKISSFTASPATIDPGESATLKWSTTGATSLSIDQGVGKVTGTSVEVSPSATTTYTLTATNSVGPVKATVTVTVREMPKISSFTASPATIDPGGSSRLKWRASNATTLSISPGIGTLTALERRLYARTGLKVSPSKTTTYTLKATNSVGSVTAQVTVTVRGSPKISSFSASPTTIDKGKSATLRWRTTDADTLTIDQGVGTVTGTSVKVSPSVTTTYTLKAANSVGSVTATAKVTIRGSPKISSFTASPATIDKGKSSTLKWSVTNATSLTIDQGVGKVTGTSVKVSPSVTTTYTLTATNAVGSATSTAKVTVRGSPKISSFTASPETIAKGERSTLRWSTSNADTLSISPGIGTLSAVQRRAYSVRPLRVSPTETTTYTLKATNSVGSVTATAKVTVGPPRISGTISVGTLNPCAIETGKATCTAKIQWTVKNTSLVKVYVSANGGTAKLFATATGDGSRDATGIKPSPNEYVFSLYDYTGDTRGALLGSVTVTGRRVPTGTFTATPETIDQGDFTTLKWSTANADSVSIDRSIGTVSASGTRKVSPNSTTTYTLNVTNEARSVKLKVTVTVRKKKAPTISFFTATPATIDKGKSAALKWSTTDAETLSISPGIGTLTDAQRRAYSVRPLRVSPTETTTYTLKATNSVKSVTATVTVTVRKPSNASGTISASPNPCTIPARQTSCTSTISWTVKNTKRARVYVSLAGSKVRFGDEVTGDGSRDTDLISSTPSVFSLYDYTGGVLGKLLASVEVKGRWVPTISYFYAIPHTINKRREVTLGWGVNNADTVSISPDIGPDIGEVTGETLKVSPSRTTTYTLTATNPVGSKTATRTVTVREPPEGTISASPNPCTIYHDEETCTPTVTWESKNTGTVQVWYSLNGGEELRLKSASTASGGPYMQKGYSMKGNDRIVYRLYEYFKGTPEEWVELAATPELTAQTDIGCRPPASN